MGWARLKLIIGVGVCVGCGDSAEAEPLVADVADIASVGDTESDTTDVNAPPARLVIANAVLEGHALYPGQQQFLYDTWGAELDGEWPPAEFLLELMEAEPEVFGNQFASFGFIADPEDDFPVGFKRGSIDPEQMHDTCGLCHVAELPDGRVWLGAPALRLDFERFRVEVDRRWVAAGNPARVSEQLRSKKLSVGPGRTDVEPAEYPRLIAADYPPYFDLDQRRYLNYMGTGGNGRTEAFLSLYVGFGAGFPTDEEALFPFPTDEYVGPFLEFLGSMRPPSPPPGSFEVAAAERGKAVFDTAGCGMCHHPEDVSKDEEIPIDANPDGRDRLPGENPAWPNGSIHTSPDHRIRIDGDGEGGGQTDPGVELVLFIINQGLEVRVTEGYRVAPLGALWATAPYLHNGSVPTIADLLRPSTERPKTFERHGFQVDTTASGNSNQGHEFGTALSETEKTDLQAYLLSL
ncbi:MAG: hypothetical protein ACI9WU_004905 [Myxococcota bacterium]|jgi:hypothetical protein